MLRENGRKLNVPSQNVFVRERKNQKQCWALKVICMCLPDLFFNWQCTFPRRKANKHLYMSSFYVQVKNEFMWGCLHVMFLCKMLLDHFVNRNSVQMWLVFWQYFLVRTYTYSSLSSIQWRNERACKNGLFSISN